MRVLIDVEVTATIPIEVTADQFDAILEAGALDFEELAELGITIMDEDVMENVTYAVATNIEEDKDNA